MPLIVTVSAYNAIKWEDPLQAKVVQIQNTLDWVNSHPYGGTYGEGQDAGYFNAQQVQELKTSLQEQLGDLQNPSQAKADELRGTLDWLNAHPDGGAMGEGQNSYSAEQVLEAKIAIQEQLDDVLAALNQSGQTNASTNSFKTP